MKTPEDEAFDDLAKRQGDWGSGFQAKRQMAADKLQDESDMLTIAYLDGYEKGKKAALAQPAQEPDYWLGYGLQAHTEKPFENATALYTTPPKRELEEWNAALDEAAARIAEMKGFGQATQDSFAIYIKGLKK